MHSANYIREAQQPRSIVLRGALSYPDLYEQDHFQTLAVIWNALRFNAWNAAKIVAFLVECRCLFDLATVQFMLDAYTGTDPKCCLWSRDQAGRYRALEVPEAPKTKRRSR